ncbi:ParB/Srx family N-terminal domain-containing protein [Klebsiella michiganensis]|uniref:ParB/Srx family N-terminal domain-containing protein n=1 Tax=Klebsiella michiganensis TaxID=1134687 RepID=UPI000D651BFF|nr:ParB/Srx family N-terminal domain-containing protein [Klebsiella michiganensis]
MKRDIRSINFNLIKLDQENVRFGGDIAQNQREAIELMLADPEDAKKIIKLAEHIALYGLDPTELQLVTPDHEGNYIVLEGNRRLTALKLLQRPDLCTQEKYYRDFLAAHNEIVRNFPNEIECSVVATREDGDVWIELKHTGQNGGAGRVPWDSDIRDERRASQTGVESIGRQIREIVRDNPAIFNEIAISDIYQIPVTTLTRLFASKRAQDAFAVFINGEQVIVSSELRMLWMSSSHSSCF